MPDRLLSPDVLVLAAGGTLGEAWMTGLLAGIEEAAGVDYTQVESYVGTSAGSIVASSLAAGRRPRRPREARGSRAGGRAAAMPGAGADGATELAARVAATAWAATVPLVAPALMLGAPVGARARALALARLPAGRRRIDGLRRLVDESGARFDGRLRVCAVDRSSGRRVVFGAPRAPRTTVGEAVQASCAIPWIFAPVEIGGREYVDGGAWSLTNLDVAPARRGTQVLCLNVLAGGPLALSSAFGALRAAARAIDAVERQLLTTRGATVRTIGPDAEATDAIGPQLMDRRRAPQALAAGYRQGLRIGA